MSKAKLKKHLQSLPKERNHRNYARIIWRTKRSQGVSEVLSGSRRASITTWINFHSSFILLYIVGADGILLWFPSQNRMFLVRKPYGFGTKNVKGRLPETESKPFNYTLIRILQNRIDVFCHAFCTIQAVYGDLSVIFPQLPRFSFNCLISNFKFAFSPESVGYSIDFT